MSCNVLYCDPDAVGAVAVGAVAVAVAVGITHIKWMTDKVTREFYGSTFVEMKDPTAAAAAVMLDKTKLLGR